ncbi:ABC transporter ATP-binding protein [Planctomicrobium sp. SH668]|uniref:ABC transporter ATP-binding protein n=1 Tax=Planctomicrobium sp. SH668 TaxID=3448126 RepID=UPI003F5C2987
MMIQCQNLFKTFRSGQSDLQVLKGLSCTFGKGSFNFILGPSGSGKSTLLYLLGGLDDPSSGEIIVDGRSLGAMNAAERDQYRREEIGFIFQNFNLLKNLNALQNTLVPYLVTGYSASTQNRARELLDRVGLKNRWRHRPNELSGGEQQRVAIARAILKKPKLILADEPTGELDGDTGKLIFDLLRQLHHEEGVTVITVTHDERYLTPEDSILRLENGQLKGSS